MGTSDTGGPSVSMMGAEPMRARLPGPRLGELFHDLLWPRLLRTPALALHPGRLGFAFFLLAALVLIDNGVAALRGLPEGGGVLRVAGGMLARVIDGLFSWRTLLDLGRLLSAVRALIADIPAIALGVDWLAALIVLPIALALWMVVGGAIARSAAVDEAQGVGVPWPRALGFALARWASLIGSALVPILMIAAILLGLAATGAVLLQLPVLDVAGGALYGLALLAGFAAVLLAVAFLFGFPMLAPAVAADGADAIDAVQRAYAYVFGRPLRLVMYAAAAGAVSIVALTIAAAVVGGTIEATAWAATAWTSRGEATPADDPAYVAGGRARQIVRSEPTSSGSLRLLEPRPASVRGLGGAGDGVLEHGDFPVFQNRFATADPPVELHGTAGVARRLVRFWVGVLQLFVAAYGVSLFFCGSTLVYLLMRRVCDGQDAAEIYTPGLIERTMQETMAARAAATNTAAEPAGGGLPASGPA